MEGHCHRNKDASNVSTRSSGGPAVAAHTAHSDTSCSTDVTSVCMPLVLAPAGRLVPVLICTVFSFHCVESAVHHCYVHSLVMLSSAQDYSV